MFTLGKGTKLHFDPDTTKNALDVTLSEKEEEKNFIALTTRLQHNWVARWSNESHSVAVAFEVAGKRARRGRGTSSMH